MNRWPLLLLALDPACASALTYAYRVEVQNELAATVVVELRQYHAPTFNGTRPATWSNDLLVHSHRDALQSGQRAIKQFNTAGGGFWVVWKVTEYGSAYPLCEGEIRWSEGKHLFHVRIGSGNCANKR
jgi:hypothetical protein